MRYCEFNESVLQEKTTDNIRILQEVADIVLAKVPKIAKDEVKTVHGQSLNLDSLYDRYQGTSQEKILDEIVRTTFHFNNEERYINSREIGWFLTSPGLRTIVILISAFTRDSETRSMHDLLKMRHPDRTAIKTLRAILVHELRHLAQNVVYPAYYFSRKKKGYAVDPIEIDAAWYHHLQDFDVNDYNDVKVYINAVMKSFSAYKKLNNAEKQHYLRKTASYFYQMKRGGGEDPLLKPDRFVTKLNKRRTEMKDALVDIVNRLRRNDYDLRNLPGYDPSSERLFFPVDRVAPKVIYNIRNARKSNDLASIVFLTVALAMNDSDNAKQIANYLKSILGITVADAVDKAQTTFKGGFDADAMTRFIVNRFGI